MVLVSWRVSNLKVREDGECPFNAEKHFLQSRLLELQLAKPLLSPCELPPQLFYTEVYGFAHRTIPVL